MHYANGREPEPGDVVKCLSPGAYTELSQKYTVGEVDVLGRVQVDGIFYEPSRFELVSRAKCQHTIRDSGAREAFGTGSVRDTREGKGRYDLISPIALARLALHYERGCEKYGERNWEKGQPLARYLDSAMRHVNNYLAGDRVEDHLTAACWNLFAFIHTETLINQGKLPEELRCPNASQLTTRPDSKPIVTRLGGVTELPGEGCDCST